MRDEPDLNKFYKWTDSILIIKSSCEETYYQFLGRQCRDGSSCILYLKQYSDFQTIIERVKPSEEELSYIKEALKLPGDYLGIVPLKNHLCLICLTLSCD